MGPDIIHADKEERRRGPRPEKSSSPICIRELASNAREGRGPVHAHINESRRYHT